MRPGSNRLRSWASSSLAVAIVLGMGSRLHAAEHEVTSPTPGGPEYFWLGEAPTRVRAARWRASGPARGTLILFPGRSSILGLRMPFLKPVHDQGWTIYSWDWRGQGESDRWLKNPRLIDVQSSFDEYVQDALEVLAQAKQDGAPSPVAAMGVSLGGHVLLRTLQEGAALDAAVLQVPLCDVKTRPWPASVARLFARVANRWGLGDYAAPGQPTIDIKAVVSRIQRSPQMEAAKAFIEAHPQTITDTVTIRWADAMFRSIDQARSPERLSKIRTPTLLVAADQDQICDTKACEEVASHIPGAQFLLIQGDHFFFTQAQAKLEGLQSQVAEFLNHVAPALPL
jgi:lysophospholipase